jgi:phosphoglycolate phosphatase-like HAD superfamily hydrolase
MRTALVLEIEELLFDTGAVRTQALREALQQEGATIDTNTVAVAHSGVPVAIALDRLAPLLTLDATGRDLVLLRAAEQASRSFATHAPSFHTGERDELMMLAAEFPLAVVTRASAEEAQRWLEGAGLEANVLTVRSLAAVDPSDYHAIWSDALRRTHATRGVAIAAPALLRTAQRAGLRTIQVGHPPDPDPVGYHPDAQVESLSALHRALIATL